jgi:hypothetical protein
MTAAIDGAADPVCTRLDEVVETQADAAALADPDRCDFVVDLRALEAVHVGASLRA